MKTIKIIFNFVIVAVILSSCVGKEQNLEKLIQNKNNPVQYVIEGQISNIVKRQYIFVSKSGGINGDNNYQGVDNAVVQVSDGATVWKFTKLPVKSKKFEDLYTQGVPYLSKGGVYESNTYFAGKTGKTYTLTVEIGGEKFTAQETMPEAEKMTDKEFEILQSTNEFSSLIFGTEKSAIWTSSSSYFTYNSIVSKEDLKLLILGRINFFEKNYFEDITKEQVSDYHILKSSPEAGAEEQVTLRRYTATPEYFEYIWAYVFGQANSILSLEQNPHPCNFDSEKIAGYFSVINCNEYKVNPNLYIENLIDYFTNSKIYTANYGDQGQFTLKTNADGSCELEGLNQKLAGAYDIINNKDVRVYFTRKYSEVPKELYHFYEVVLKQALLPYPTPGEEEISYWSKENAIFEIQNDGSIKAQDGTIWN